MLVTEELAKKIKIKRALTNTTKKQLQNLCHISFQTLTKAEKGDYDMNRQSYNRLMAWLESED